MIKKYWLKVCLFILVLGLAACSNQNEDDSAIVPKLGINYETLALTFPFQKPAEHEVLEFFSYGCIHCYRAEKSIDSWLKQKAQNINFIKIPVSFGENTLFAQIFYTFEAMGILDKAHSAFFDAIHQEKLQFRNLQEIFNWMRSQGFDDKKAEQIFNSTIVRIKTDRSVELVEQYGINSTPSFIIDGKYLTGPAKTNSHEKTMQLINLILAGNF